MASFSSETYSKEELVAEMGSSFIMKLLGLENKSTIENSAAYIASWLRQLRNEKKLIVSAAGKAEKATKYILGDKIETLAI